MCLLKYRLCTLIACLSFAAFAGASAQEEQGEKPEKVKSRREVEKEGKKEGKKEAAEKAGAVKTPPAAKDQANDKPRHSGPPPGAREGMRKRMEGMHGKHPGAEGGTGWSPEKMEGLRKQMGEMRRKHGGAPGKGGPPWAQEPQEKKPASPPWAGSGKGPGQGPQGFKPGGPWGRDGGFAGPPKWGMGPAGTQGQREMMMFRRMQMGAMASAGHGMRSAPGKTGADGLCDNCKRKLGEKNPGNRKAGKTKKADAGKKQQKSKKKQE